MAAGPTGLRSPDDTPRPPGGTGPGPATLAGMAPGGGEGGPEGEAATPEGGGAGGGMQKMLGTALQTVMKTEVMLTPMARQFPAAAPALLSAQEGMRQAVNGIRAALRQVLTNPGQPEPPPPNIGG